MNCFEQVVDFNRNVLGIEPRPLTYPHGPEMDHALKCLREEHRELSDAYQSGDFIGCVDANIDTIYFAIGNLYKMGLTAEQMEQIFTIVHVKNMSKSAGQVESRATDGAVDAVKPDGWVGPEEEIAKVLDTIPVAEFTTPLGSGVDIAENKNPPDNPDNDPATVRARQEAMAKDASREGEQG